MRPGGLLLDLEGICYGSSMDVGKLEQQHNSISWEVLFVYSKKGDMISWLALIEVLFYVFDEGNMISWRAFIGSVVVR